MLIHYVMLWEFKQSNSTKSTAEKISSIRSEGIITDRAARNWFVKFDSGDSTVKDKLRVGCSYEFDNNLLNTILEQNLRQSTKSIGERLNTSQ